MRRRGRDEKAVRQGKRREHQRRVRVQGLQCFFMPVCSVNELSMMRPLQSTRGETHILRHTKRLGKNKVPVWLPEARLARIASSHFQCSCHGDAILSAHGASTTRDRGRRSC